VLLAYDGSSRADEALFVATYLADRWKTSLTIVTVIENGQVSPDTLSWAQIYLESHGVQGIPVEESGPVPEAILKTAEEQGSDLIIMGSYGHSPVLEVMFGSAVDQVLREALGPR
jgi:nucleotide-binding universal stress UspA family protein